MGLLHLGPMIANLPVPFGRYLLVDKIATGGMAEIFKAKLIGVEGFEKIVVIKRILPFWSERRDFIAMLVDEAKIVVHLNHPNIIQVFELGLEGKAYFIAMEYVDGVDLKKLRMEVQKQGEILPYEFSVKIMIDALRGLEYAHSRKISGERSLNIVHRDISPQNILVSFEGEVKVGDFGIAQAVTQTHETQTGVLKGKYAYMSPEQALGQALDARSDLFSCGVVLYEMLFGQKLFVGKSDLEVLDKVRRVYISWPEDLTSQIPSELLVVLKKALSLNVEDRFSTAAEFADRLEQSVLSHKASSAQDLGVFLRKIFRENLKIKRMREQRIQHQTQSFLKSTRVSPIKPDRTISLAGDFFPDSTDLSESGFVATERGLIPDKKKGYKKYLVLTLLAVSLLILFLILRHELLPAKVAENPTLDVVEEKPAQVLREKEVVKLPPQSEGSISIQVIPAQANINLSYGDRVVTAAGEARMQGIPLEQQVGVDVALKGYRNVHKSLRMSQNQLDFRETIHLEKIPPSVGAIRINASPWGKVSMAGYFSGRETPVVGSSIPEGKYKVIVSNPTINKDAVATAWIRGGHTTRCYVDFEKQASLSCY